MAVVSADAPQPLDKLSGLIERVTYFNEETGFAVLRVKASGHRDLVTVIGSRRLPCRPHRGLGLRRLKTVESNWMWEKARRRLRRCSSSQSQRFCKRFRRKSSR